MLPMHRDKIMYTDTDNLIHHIECNDVYDIMKYDIASTQAIILLITCIVCLSLTKKYQALMKDENNSAIMTEFIGLRTKMCALRVDGKKEKSQKC